MAVLAVAALGAVIGSSFGMASAGFLVGEIIGNMLFGSKGPKTTVTGPRLGDLTVQASTYGTAIPYAYGTVRMSGNVIWSEKIKEKQTTSTTHSHGGKGGGHGGSQTTITYTYSCSFAVAFGQGPAADVLRIWADSKLIFDKLGDGTEVNPTSPTPTTQVSGFNYRFYPGDETQIQDSLIAADLGIANVNANRGLCYIVFDTLQLADFGNRIPNITAEIVFSTATTVRPRLDAVLINDSTVGKHYQSNVLGIDYTRHLIYTEAIFGGHTAIRRTQWDTMIEDRVVLDTVIFGGDATRTVQNFAVGSDGYIYTPSKGGNSRDISRIDPNSLHQVAVFGAGGSSSLSNTTLQFVDNEFFGMVSPIGATGKIDYLICGGIFNTWGILQASNMSYVYGSGVTVDESRVSGIISGPSTNDVSSCWIIGSHQVFPGSATLGIYQVDIAAGAIYDPGSGQTYGVTVTKLHTYNASDFISTATKISANAVGYDPTDGGLVIAIFEQDGTASGATCFVKYIPSTDSILWNTPTPEGLNESDPAVGSNSRLNGQFYYYMRDSNMHRIDLRTGALTTDSGWSNGEEGAGFYDANTNTLTAILGSTGYARFFLGRGSTNGAALSDIVVDLCERSGLSNSDVDVSALTGIDVLGYFIGSPSSARDAITPLSHAYLFDGVESDYLLKFVLRGGNSVATITQKNIGILDKNLNEFWRETRVQELELPERIYVTYMDIDNQYQQGTQSEKRVKNPTNTMHSSSQVNLALPIAMNATTAKQIAQKWCYSSWIERTSYAAIFSWAFLALDPTDIITVALDSGSTFICRPTKIEIGADLSMNMQMVSNNSPTYGSTAVGQSGQGLPTPSIANDGVTRLFIPDTPLLRDIDDVGRVSSREYYMMAGYGPAGWPGALLYKSPDSAAYVQIGQSNIETPWGSISNTLGSMDSTNVFSPDKTNTIIVFMTIGADQLASCTMLQMLNGSNAAMILKADGTLEIIQFQNVTANADGSYTLDTLLRGRRGTDTMANGYVGGETFVLLLPSAVQSVQLSLSEINLQRYYKGVGFRQLFDQAAVDAQTQHGRDLMPWAPIHHKAVISGSDLILSWVRRTRINGGMVDLFGDVSLNEDTESYSIDIYNGSTIVRTLTSTTNSVTYTAANITSDFGSIPATLKFAVYQISAQVGRGFAYTLTVPTS